MQAVNQALRRVPSWVVYPLGLLPFLWLVFRGVTGDLGVDPVKEVEHSLGLTALQFILGGLVITPLRWLTGINLIRYRRAVGLVAFFYACLHLLVWLVLDIQLRWGEIWSDLVRRPYIAIGMVALLILIPLAVTSNTASIRKLGKNWVKLHRMVYVVAILGAVHFLMVVKAWPTEPLIYLALSVLLVGFRLYHLFVVRG
ncbi:protein-methionine-sulfoxide reductase heme-binding subunit MsrQ [Falsirhodobacter sp. alg1]|uniref:protein-methionine-sulfoxide reductase heme-binding subunit MsrQ n=1 Tax=Falsirhodobacter sp. alg1 TaxID=1472418 RepID=UPI0005ED7DEA|nr:protein-methionine-sulfoxide reductase heme-binding subunit MsrQ [Falsirhodobacter sp. alg1]